MKAMTIEGLFELNQKQNELIEKLLIKAELLERKAEKLEKKVESLEREVTKNASPWVRGWQGVADYTQQSRASIIGNTDLKRSLTQYKITGKTVLFKKSDIDESIEGTAVR